MQVKKVFLVIDKFKNSEFISENITHIKPRKKIKIRFILNFGLLLFMKNKIEASKPIIMI